MPCYWCGKRQGRRYIPWCHRVFEHLCDGCIDWACNRVDNPKRLPPQPDGRTVTHDFLKRLFHQKRYSYGVDWRVVAEFLRDWYEPGRINPRTGQGISIQHAPRTVTGGYIRSQLLRGRR